MVSVSKTKDMFRILSNIFKGAFEQKQKKRFFLNVRQGSKYAYKHIKLMDQFCKEIRISKGIRLLLRSSPEVKQLTD